MLKVIEANISDTKDSFLDLYLSIVYGVLITRIYDKKDYFDFDINYPHLDVDVPCATSYKIYISQQIRFDRAGSNVRDINYRNQVNTLGKTSDRTLFTWVKMSECT